jgi:hypothetical protein
MEQPDPKRHLRLVPDPVPDLNAEAQERMDQWLKDLYWTFMSVTSITKETPKK